MGLERRGRVRQSYERSNWQQKDLDACDRQAVQVRPARLPDGSRVRREFHARFCERPVVQFHRPTHPPLPQPQQRVSFQLFRPQLGANHRSRNRLHSPVPRKARTFSAALFRMRRVEPFFYTICRFLRAANKRVTVSRDVPIICAISSWVSASLKRGSALAASPFCTLQSNSSFASLSAAEWGSPIARISRQAALYLSLNCSATCRQASLCSLSRRWKSSRFTKFTWHGSTVSAVNS